MRKVSRRIANLAGRLLQTPAAGAGAAPETPEEAFLRRYESVRPRLTELVGRIGFRALLTRSLSLATAERPWLSAVQVDTEGCLTGLHEALAGPGAAESEGCCTALLAHLLGLLASLIGAELTGLLLSGAWPDIPMVETDFATDEGEG